MPQAFDATLKEIVQAHSRDFEVHFRLAVPSPSTVLNVDLSTITAATDIALGHGEPLEAITDLNFQSNWAPGLLGRVLLYNVLLHHRFQVPVHSIVLLLRPKADHPSLTGRLQYQGQPRRGKVDFKFEVVRLWQQPVRRFLRGGLGILPLATLCQIPPDLPQEDALRRIIRAIDKRLRAEASPNDAAQLMTAAAILTGMRVPSENVRRLFQGVSSMIESSTFELFEAMGMQKILMQFGRKHLGEPSAATKASLEDITDPDRLQRMAARVEDVNTWAELLQTP